MVSQDFQIFLPEELYSEKLNKPVRSYNLKSDPKDWKDRLYVPTNNTLSPSVDLREFASPVEDQGHLGSCVGNAIVGAYELLLNKEAPTQFVDLSRLFVYYNARIPEGTENEDNGAYVRNGIKGVKRYGICKESLWPYVIRDFAVSPSAKSYEDAKHRNIKNYFRLINLDDILDALNNGIPVVQGLVLYENFEKLNKKNFVLDVPNKSENEIGAHAVCLVGYNLAAQQILVRNSFGADWCLGGYFWITFDYVKSESLDNWIFDIDLIT